MTTQMALPIAASRPPKCESVDFCKGEGVIELSDGSGARKYVCPKCVRKHEGYGWVRTC